MKDIHFKLTTDRLNLLVPGSSYAEAVLDYFRRNDNYLNQYSGQDYTGMTLESTSARLEKGIANYKSKEQVVFYMEEKSDPGRIIGTISFYDIFRDNLQMCYTGYSVDENCQGRGYASEGLMRGVLFVFGEWNLHKVIASFMPRNERSRALVRKLGFAEEGIAREESFINGIWEDAVQASILNDRWDVDRWKREHGEA